MPEIKVLMVMTDAVNEPTLREFLRLGGYQFSTAYLQAEAEPPPREAGDPPTKETTAWWSFCAECGPNVMVDEDGCCASCGTGAMGPEVIKEGVKRYSLEKVLETAKEALKYADVIGRCPERAIAFNNLEAAIAKVVG